MRAIEFSMYGDPGEVLEIAKLPIPTPRAGQVLVRMTQRPINPSDLYMVRGHYGFLPALPAVPGFEGCGVIEELGPDVSGFQVDQRVIPVTLKAGGSWAEHVVVDANSNALISVPDRLADEVAAQFVINPLSAWIMVTSKLALVPGDWLVQTAAASTVGRIVTKLSAAIGINTINIVHRKQRAAELRENGVQHVLCTESDDVYAQIKALTNNAGADGALDAVGGRVAADIARALRPHAKFIVYGLLSGKAITFDTSSMLFNANTIEGFWLPHVLQRHPGNFAQAANELMANPLLPTLVAGVAASYDIAEVTKAVRHAERAGQPGKIMLVT